MITSGRIITRPRAANWIVAFHLPSIDGSRWLPCASTAARRPSRVNSRPMMMIANQGETRSTASSATSAPATRSLSAVVSRNEPRRVVTFQRRASRPSNQSVAAAERKTIAAAVSEPPITSAITIGTATIRMLVPAISSAVARSGPVRGALSAPASMRAILPTPSQRPKRPLPGLLERDRAQRLLHLGDERRRHAELGHAEAHEQDGGVGVPGQLAAHSHPAAVRLGALHGLVDQAEHRRLR